MGPQNSHPSYPPEFSTAFQIFLVFEGVSLEWLQAGSLFSPRSEKGVGNLASYLDINLRRGNPRLPVYCAATPAERSQIDWRGLLVLIFSSAASQLIHLALVTAGAGLDSNLIASISRIWLPYNVIHRSRLIATINRV